MLPLQVPGYGDDKFERGLHKLEDHLYSHEPHLAQLLQLDNIGAHVLGPRGATEKSLR